MRIFKKVFTSREFFLLIVIGVLLLILGLKSDFFFTMDNLKGVMLNISIYGIVAAGMTILFVSRGIDLSVGTVMATLGVILGRLFEKGLPVPIVIIIVLITGAVIGSSIGLLITKVGINPFIATLAYFFCFRGLSFILALSKGEFPFFGNFPASYNRIAGGTFHGVEYIIFYAVAIVIIYQILLSKNVFFRQNFFLGGNETAARVVGIKINLLKIFNYALVSTTGAIAIILRASRVGGTNATFGYPSFALIVVTGVILGGGSLKGGGGSVIGSFLGVGVISIIYNAMVMLNINPFYTEFSIGLILLVSIILDENIRKIPMHRLKKVKE